MCCFLIPREIPSHEKCAKQRITLANKGKPKYGQHKLKIDSQLVKR